MGRKESNQTKQKQTWNCLNSVGILQVFRFDFLKFSNLWKFSTFKLLMVLNFKGMLTLFVFNIMSCNEMMIFLQIFYVIYNKSISILYILTYTEIKCSYWTMIVHCFFNSLSFHP